MQPDKLHITASDRVLADRIGQGDARAFRMLYDRYRHKVYAFAFKIIQSKSHAEDILHDVFLSIWKRGDLTDIEELEAYLKVTTRNRTLKVLRRIELEIRTHRRLAAEWEDKHNEMEDTLLRDDLIALLHKGIERLPPQQKRVYTLCHEEGLKYAEVAEQLSISPYTVKTHMQHALRFLRRYMNQYADVILLVGMIGTRL